MTRPQGEYRATPVQRVVLLGASNLTKGIATVLDTALAIWGGPLDVLAAWGHGRSYGQSSRVLVRELPGICQCGLWTDLARPAAVPTAALVTDIGNDLLYEQPVARISGWVEACFDRLAAAEARTVVALLPLDSLPSVSPAQFYFFRTLFAPRCRLRLDEAQALAADLDERVERLARARGFATIRPRSQWYGLDPIHIRLSWRRRAWREILAPLAADEAMANSVLSVPGRWLYLRTRTPERCHMFGFERRGRQPAARFADGTTVALY